MALVMSASAIHAQSTLDPSAVLDALLRTIREELESTEMFITTFYTVLDPDNKRLRYANAGHPHAFLMDASGDYVRLAALDPPLGMSTDHPSTKEFPWESSNDLLVLFTDGVPDARNRQDTRFGERRVLEIVRARRAESPSSIIDAVLAEIRDHVGDATRRDDLTMVIART